ncbi:MAG: hypothetical protein ACXWQO_04325 [Bdellovibrionota bacterium]
MKKIHILFLSMAAVVLAALSVAPAKAKQNTASFGACYTLYNCQGGSIGSYDDMQCRNMGGHSINSGGLCMNL